MNKRVWVQMELELYPVRIFRTHKAAIESGTHIQHMDRAEAVRSIRDRLWLLSESQCMWCGFPVSYENFHMHEVVPRGAGGEISLENSVVICAECHIIGPDAAHSNRRPRFKGTY
jgi:5-methylcytosine-specific restriction endonuclease McrA